MSMTNTLYKRKYSQFQQSINNVDFDYGFFIDIEDQCKYLTTYIENEAIMRKKYDVPYPYYNNSNLYLKVNNNDHYPNEFNHKITSLYKKSNSSNNLNDNNYNSDININIQSSNSYNYIKKIIVNGTIMIIIYYTLSTPF